MDLFRNCPLDSIGPDDGRYVEYPGADMAYTATIPHPDGYHLVFGAIENTIKRSTAYSIETVGMDLEKGNFQIMHFRRVFEIGGSCAFDFHRVTLFGEGGRATYVYVVNDVIISRAAGRNEASESFRLRAISNPIDILTPERGWCRESGNWFWLSDELPDFNKDNGSEG